MTGKTGSYQSKKA